MGSPQKPTSAQIAALETAGMLQTTGNPKTMTVNNEKIMVDLNLPRQAVVLLKLEWK